MNQSIQQRANELHHQPLKLQIDDIFMELAIRCPPGIPHFKMIKFILTDKMKDRLKMISQSIFLAYKSVGFSSKELFAYSRNGSGLQG